MDGARRLAAVAFADLVGYTILTAREEDATHARWMRLLNDVIRPLAERHNGRFVKSTGDGALTEFRSALDAVRWAESVQQAALAASAAGAGDDTDGGSALVLRIAVHLGDVVTTEFDIYGDGVNIAARLQEHAPPGGIVVSEAVRDLVRGSYGARLRDLGQLTLKNMEEPVHAWLLEADTIVPDVPRHPRRSVLPSIAVLPLRNLGANQDDRYFADGLVEDVIASLCGLRELLVIAHSSTLSFGEKPVSPLEVGRVANVRYVLTGSIRRTSDLLRISVQLWDVETGVSMWADRAEMAPSGVFDMQDEIVRKIVAGIAPHIRSTELRRAMRKRPGSFTAYDHTLRALHVMHDLRREIFDSARMELEQAIAADDTFAMPVAWLARWYSLSIGQGWAADPTGDSARARDLAVKAIELEPENALALATFAHLKLYLEHDHEIALEYFARALQACPNHALSWMLSAGALASVGRGAEAVEHAERGLRLSPLDKSVYAYHTALALAYYTLGDAATAERWSRLAETENPTYTAGLRYRIAALVALGNLETARTAAARLLVLEPNFTLSHYASTRQPFNDIGLRARYLGHLATSGLPS